VNFRTRVTASAAIVVAVAIMLACGVAYATSRDALIGSTDASLNDAYQLMYHPYNGTLQPGAVGGVGIFLCDQDGSPILHVALLDPRPNATILAVASGKASLQYATVDAYGGEALRELIAPIPAETALYWNGSLEYLPSSAALVLVEPFGGTLSRLHSLGWTLLIVALIGIVLAALFGWLVARSSLVPLTETTREIEDVATNLDVSRRVEEGRDDELGRLRRACNQLLEALQLSQDSQRQLILDSSHELRTPLTSLRANAQVLGRLDELDADDVQQLSGDMVTQVDELTTLVGDLSELARGVHSVEAEQDLSLDDLVAECCEIAETHARTRQVDVVVTTEPCIVHAKRTRLVRAIGNLLDNAIKFSPEGGEVHVTCRRGVVTVEDSGHGIDDADVPHVFDRFYRSSRDRGLPGSGLGLAIVAQVVTEADGSIEVGRSEALGGAMLTLRLPRTSGASR
jgi:two-component system, OmpR family, sensor histidine kinase MprB